MLCLWTLRPAAARAQASVNAAWRRSKSRNTIDLDDPHTLQVLQKHSNPRTLLSVYNRTKRPEHRVQIGDMMREQNLRLPLKHESDYLRLLTNAGRAPEAISLWRTRAEPDTDTVSWLQQGVELAARTNQLAEAERLAERLEQHTARSNHQFPAAAAASMVRVYAQSDHAARLEHWLRRLADTGNVQLLRRETRYLSRNGYSKLALELLEQLEKQAHNLDSDTLLQVTADNPGLVTPQFLAQLASSDPAVVDTRKFRDALKTAKDARQTSRAGSSGHDSAQAVYEIEQLMSRKKYAAAAEMLADPRLTPSDMRHTGLNMLQITKRLKDKAPSAAVQMYLAGTQNGEQERSVGSLQRELKAHYVNERYESALLAMANIQDHQVNKRVYNLYWKILARYVRSDRNGSIKPPSVKQQFEKSLAAGAVTPTYARYEPILISAIGLREWDALPVVLKNMVDQADVVFRQTNASHLLRLIARALKLGIQPAPFTSDPTVAEFMGRTNELIEAAGPTEAESELIKDGAAREGIL